MSEDKSNRTQSGEPNDDLRRDLRGVFDTSSDTHDAKVLAAARDVASDIQARQTRPRRRWLLPVAAGLASLALLPTLFAPEAPSTLTRGPADEVLPVHRATLTEPPAEFQWPAVAGARTYHVELLNAAAEPVWKSDAVAGTSIDADAAASAMTIDGNYLWVVTATTRDSTVELGPYWFRLEY